PRALARPITPSAARRNRNGRQRQMGAAARVGSQRRPSPRQGLGTRGGRGGARAGDPLPDVVRVFSGKLAAPFQRSEFPDAAVPSLPRHRDQPTHETGDPESGSGGSRPAAGAASEGAGGDGGGDAGQRRHDGRVGPLLWGPAGRYQRDAQNRTGGRRRRIES